LHFEPFEIKDIDVYTCVVEYADGLVEKSIGFDYNFNYFKLKDQADKSPPKIIEIYRFGEQRVDTQYELNCKTGNLIV
jgi:hypothetical protein